jgi:hypothetical protein
VFEAQYLFKGDAVFSPWMPREGNVIRGTFDVLELSGVNFVIELATKNRDETGNGDLRTAKITTATEGVKVMGWGGLKELVRFRYSTDSGTNNYDYALFRMLTPIWYDAVKA